MRSKADRRSLRRSAIISPLAIALLELSVPTDVHAQALEQANDEILVRADRRPFNIRPERTIPADELLVYGRTTVGELLDDVTAESGARANDVTILVNGRRVSDLGAVANLPAEVLDRLDILPRGSGTNIGAPAIGRVYNVVLKSTARVMIARGQKRFTTEPGLTTGFGEISATRIRGSERINSSVQISGQDSLLESERNIIQSPGTAPSRAKFRSLLPSLSGLQAITSWADEIAPWLDGLATVTASQQRVATSVDLTAEGTEISRASRLRVANLNMQLNATKGSWLATLETGVRRDSRETVLRSGPNMRPLDERSSASRVDSSHLELRAHGPIGQLGTSLIRGSLSASIRRDVITNQPFGSTPITFARTTREVLLGLEIPLVTRSGPIPLGDLALSAQISEGRVSSGETIGQNAVVLRWVPAEWLLASASINRSRSSPGSDLLAEPILETPAVLFYDPLRGETVEVQTRSGGRLDLPRLAASTHQASVNLRPLSNLDVLISAEYSGVRFRNVPGNVSPASELIVRSFPERFSRNADGILTAVDLRPVVFSRQSEDRLRLGFTMNLPLAIHRGGRVQVSASRSVLLESQLQVADGTPFVNLLARDGSSGGATPARHQSDFSFGYAEPGLGIRLNGEHRGRSFLGEIDSGRELIFDPLATLSVRAFAEGSRLGLDSGLLRNLRFGLTVINVTNRRERVRDGNGQTPLLYEQNRRNPAGRSIELEIRRAF